MKEDRPKPETMEDGTKIVYPMWRDDLAEAVIIFPKSEKE